MKTEFYLEFDGQQKDLGSIEETIKQMWKTDGHKMKDLKSLKIYYKPQEHKAYYVFNGESKGEDDSIVI